MASNTDEKIRNLVIYQIFTRNYKEGTFLAVEKDIPRIKALGVDYIYLLPVQPSGKINRKGSMGSPYAISDYRAIDPVQGTMEDFIRLTEAVHKAGMKVMIDVVYNHTSPDSWLAKNHPEWFYHKEDGNFGNRIGDWWDVIDLDYTQKDLWSYQIDTLKFWAEYVDGFRCDVAPILPLEFWKQARAEVETVRPGCLWLAEAVEYEFIAACRKNGIPMCSDGELYQVFDICYDYDIYERQAGAMAGEESLVKYLAGVNLQEVIFPDNYSKLRCLENHDRPRAAALVPERRALFNWTAWIFFLKGTTMLYAGEEYGAVHHPTLFDLDPAELIQDNTQTEDMASGTFSSLSDLIGRLSEIKKDPIFTQSSFHAEACGADREMIVAEHEAYKDAKASTQKAIGIFSVTGRKQGLKISLPDGTYEDAISGRQVEVFEGRMRYEGDPVILLLP